MSVQASEWSKRGSDIERLVKDGHHKQALQEAGSVLEGLLRELYRRTVDRLPPAEQTKISAILEKVGKGKPVSDLSLGQIVGLFRETDLFAHAERALGRKLPHLSSANFNTFVDIRNKAVHKGESVNPKEAQFSAAQVALFIDETGFGEKASAEASAPQPRGKTTPPQWVSVVSLHPDVVSEHFSEDIFALDLGPLADGKSERSSRLPRSRALLPRLLPDQGPAFAAARRALPPQRRRRKPCAETADTVWRRQVPHACLPIPRCPKPESAGCFS